MQTINVSPQTFQPSTCNHKLFNNMFGIGLPEIIFIALIVLLFFGGKKIPELMRGLGKGVRSFKDGMNDIQNEVEKADPTKTDSTQKASDTKSDTKADTSATTGGKADTKQD